MLKDVSCRLISSMNCRLGSRTHDCDLGIVDGQVLTGHPLARLVPRQMGTCADGRVAADVKHRQSPDCHHNCSDGEGLQAQLQ